MGWISFKEVLSTIFGTPPQKVSTLVKESNNKKRHQTETFASSSLHLFPKRTVFHQNLTIFFFKDPNCVALVTKLSSWLTEVVVVIELLFYSESLNDRWTFQEPKRGLVMFWELCWCFWMWYSRYFFWSNRKYTSKLLNVSQEISLGQRTYKENTNWSSNSKDNCKKLQVFFKGWIFIEMIYDLARLQTIAVTCCCVGTLTKFSWNFSTKIRFQNKQYVHHWMGTKW